MAHVGISGHYDAPIERVFELATDFKRYPEWNVSYSEIKEVIGPPDQVGTKIHGVMRFLGRTVEGVGEIVEADPPRLLKVAGSGGDGMVVTTYRFTRTDAGTDYELEAEYELPRGIFGQIADKLFIERAVERDLRHSLENFTALLEAPQPVLV